MLRSQIPLLTTQQVQKKTRYFVSLFNILLVLCFLVFYSACTESPSKTIRFGLANAPTNLDPRFATDATSARINRLIYSPLVDLNQSYEPIPALASWEKIAPTHFRFYLLDKRPMFHNGTPVTAQDVKATYDFILDPHNTSPHRSSLAMIERIHAQGAATVDFYLSRPEPLLPSLLRIGILPENLMEANYPFQSQPIGSGPFSFLAQPDHTRLQLTRLKDQQLFEFIVVPDPTVRTLKLLAGEIDMLQNDLPPELISFLKKNEKIRVQHQQGTNFSYLGFNFLDPLTKQLPVRKAIAYAIDRDAIIQFVLGGAAELAQSILPPNHWVGTQQLKSYEYNPNKARMLLKQAGFSLHRPVRLIYKTSTDPFRVRLATILQHQLSEVGIAVDLRTYDWGTFYGDIKAGRFQMYSLSWVGIKTPDIFHYAFHSESVPPQGANRGRFSSKLADQLIDLGDQSEDIRDKQRYYQQLQAHLIETLPYIPLWFENHVFIAKSDIKGFKIAKDGNYDGLKLVYRFSSKESPKKK